MAAVLKSRKAVLGLLSLLAVVIGMLVPELRATIDQWGVLIVAIYGLASGMITIEDSVTAWAERPRTLAGTVGQLAEGLEEVLTPPPPADPAVTTTASVSVERVAAA